MPVCRSGVLKTENGNVLNLRLFIFDVVDNDIFAKVARGCKKDPPMVQAGHPIDKEVEKIPVWQHEGVNNNTRARAFVHLS